MPTLSLADRRTSPRYATRLEATVEAGGLVNTAVITNLSDSGLQLEYNRRVLDELMPNIRRPDPNKPLLLAVRWRLPDAPQEESLQATCRMLYVRRLAQDRFLSGGQFQGIEPLARERLLRFLAGLG